MGERGLVRPEDMATTSTAVATVPQALQEEPVERVAVLTLRPAAGAGRSEPRKKVVWTEDTVDNEDMNKKKSKCCCIYVKPRKFDESDTESSDSECEHCFGHVEKKKRATHTHHRHIAGTDTQESAASASTATITLQPSESEPSLPAPAPAPPEQAPSPTHKGLPAS